MIIEFGSKGRKFINANSKLIKFVITSFLNQIAKLVHVMKVFFVLLHFVDIFELINKYLKNFEIKFFPSIITQAAQCSMYVSM